MYLWFLTRAIGKLDEIVFPSQNVPGNDRCCLDGLIFRVLECSAVGALALCHATRDQFVVRH